MQTYVVIINRTISMSSVDYVSAINTKGSGLNITQIVESLVDAETKPKKDIINKKIDSKNLDISSIGTLTSEIDTLQKSLISLSNISSLKPVVEIQMLI